MKLVAEEWLTVNDAGKVLKCHPSYVYKLVYWGKLRSKKEGATRMVLTSDVYEILSRRRKGKLILKRGQKVERGQPAFALLDVSEVKTIAGKPDLLLLRHDIFLLNQTIQNLIDSMEREKV